MGYAADRGVRVMFEVDTPAHSASWCAAFPEICVGCHSSNEPNGKLSNGSFLTGCSGLHPLPPECKFGFFSLLDPSKNKTWSVIETMVSELAGISGDSFFHIGGDELHWDCWDVPHINSWMPSVGIRAGDYKAIARYYLGRVQAIVRKHKMRAVAWNEVMDQYGDAHYPPATPVPAELLDSTVIHTWYSPEWYDPPTGLSVARTVHDIAKTGRDVLVSFPWYLSANASTGPSFDSMFFQDVVSNKTCASAADGSINCSCFGRRGDVEGGCYDVSGSPEELKHVLGGRRHCGGRGSTDLISRSR